MNKYGDDDLWTCVLFINNMRDRFIVIPGEYTSDSRDERWELPTLENEFSELHPIDTVIFLAEFQLNLSIEESNLRMLGTVKDDTGSDVHIFENNSLNKEINYLFENEKSYDWYQTMPYQRAGLVHSGLNFYHKRILAEANLIKIHTQPFERHLKPVYSEVGLRDKVRDYAPKPL